MQSVEKELFLKAVKAREHAYSPYSGFRVGAALLCEDGSIYTGCNIENAAYSPTNCAERTAFYKAVSEGKRKFKMIAIAGGRETLVMCTPCGVCRQVMAEFCDAETFQIVCAEDEEHLKIKCLKEFLPYAFRL